MAAFKVGGGGVAQAFISGGRDIDRTVSRVSYGVRIASDGARGPEISGSLRGINNDDDGSIWWREAWRQRQYQTSLASGAAVSSAATARHQQPRRAVYSGDSVWRQRIIVTRQRTLA